MKAEKEIGADLPVAPQAIEAAPALIEVAPVPPAPVEIPMGLDEFCWARFILK